MSRPVIMPRRSVDRSVDLVTRGASESDSITREAARHLPGFFVTPQSIIIAGRDDERTERRAQRVVDRG